MTYESEQSFSGGGEDPEKTIENDPIASHSKFSKMAFMTQYLGIKIELWFGRSADCDRYPHARRVFAFVILISAMAIGAMSGLEDEGKKSLDLAFAFVWLLFAYSMFTWTYLDSMAHKNSVSVAMIYFVLICAPLSFLMYILAYPRESIIKPLMFAGLCFVAVFISATLSSVYLTPMLPG